MDNGGSYNATEANDGWQTNNDGGGGAEDSWE